MAETKKVTVPRSGTKHHKTKKRTGARKQQRRIRRYDDGSAKIRIGKTVADLLEGKEDVSKWTFEELERGAPMRIKRPPHVIPIEVHQELARRVTAEARHHMAANLELAVNRLVAVITNMDVEHPTGPQMKAIETILDRVMGAPEQHVTIGGDEKFVKAIQGAMLVATDEEALKLAKESGQVIDIEAVRNESDRPQDRSARKGQ